MVATKEDVEILFKKMMKDLEGCAQTDETYQEDMKNFEGVVSLQWNICGIMGYQIFSKDDYSYKFGEKIDNPGVTFELSDLDLAAKFLRCEPFEFTYAPGKRGKFEILHTVGWKKTDSEDETKKTKISKPFVTAQIDVKRGIHPFMFSKLPMFREWVKKRFEDVKEFGAYIPINKSLGTFENQILPMKIFKHFIDNACNIVVRDCPCRVERDCKDHEKSLGCMMMGSATLNMAMPPDDRGHVATKEEALEHVQSAIDNGLIPILGNSIMEAEANATKDLGHFMSVCFCCTCCCINGDVMTHSGNVVTLFQKMEGLTVEVDQDTCIGCGDCLEVCVFNSMELIDDKARVNQKRCLGCGRCETACPNEAISIKISDLSQVHELIKKLEAHVDVS
ncbi:MAG: indolepyruvate ferredoxin oxidoreductase subunit alpha [Candidatus Hodarchaeales archaeon]|jgi:UDP-glucose 4-epimerase